MHAQYELESSYIATVMDGMYVTLPTALDVRLCLMTNGHLCMFNQALYPVEHTNWCVYALFINDEKRIDKYCHLKAINHTTNLDYNLDGYLWAISALATECIQLRCVMDTCIITIKPPLQIIDVGNGCKAYSASIYIPAKSELTTTIQSITRSQFFLDYNFKYTNASKFIIWHKTDFATLTPEEIKTLKAKMLKLPTMPMDIFKKTLKNIDENYPFSLPPMLILSLLITMGIGTLIVCILFIWYKRKTSHTTSIVDNLLNLIPSLKDNVPNVDSLLPILAEQALPHCIDYNNTTIAVPHRSQPPLDGFMSPPAIMPKQQSTKPLPIVPYHATPMEPQPSTSGYNAESISLDMFNHAAADKGVIDIKKYKKYLHKSTH